MAPVTTMASKWRPRAVIPLRVELNLNELPFFETHAENPTRKEQRSRRPRRPKVAQEDKLPEVRSESPLLPPDEYGRSESRLLPPGDNDAEINTTAWERSDEIMAEVTVAQSPEPEGAVVLDPEYSERQYYREPLTGYQRAIWRPGDGDGSQSTDYYHRTGPVLPVEQRWRLFQSNIGPVGLGKEKSEPPRFVFLDDRAAYEVLTSDIQRARLNREWPHDFAANGKVRARRVHCGRPAIKDPLTSECHSAAINKTSNYPLTGEKDYKPIIYRVPTPQPRNPSVEELNRKRKADEAEYPELYNPRAHGHNQYTPKDMMVKHGAPTFSRKSVKGDDDDVLATLKAQKRTFAEGSAISGSSKADSVLSKTKTVASGWASVHSMVATPTTETIDRAATSPPENRDGGGDSDSDMELFPKPMGPPRSRVPTPAASAAAALGVTRQMGYIDRRTREEALALETMNSVQNQDDVVRIASELAKTKVALADQAKQIERLQRDLKDGQSMRDNMQAVIDEQERVMEDMQSGNGSMT